MIRLTKVFLSVVVLGLLLSAPSCRGGSSSQAHLGQINITTQINSDNSPVAEVVAVANSAPKIYASIELVAAQKGDRVDVAWRNVAQDQIVATEVFTGKRTSSRPYDFVGTTAPTTSWLVSMITLQDISWPIGDYEVTVQINRQTGQKIGFTIVTESELDIAAKQAMVKNLWLGTQINSQNQIVLPATTFNRSEETIYAVALLQNVSAGSRMKGSWKLLETGEILTNFMTEFSGGGYLPFALSLNQVGRSSWPRGNYTFTLLVDNLPVATKNFSVN
ncbi:MAG: hypothetical protein V1807_00975 [Patescibacteria group bacterium]